MSITYHIVPAKYFRDRPAEAPYTPPGFEDEGFIHCTDGEQQIADTANRYYRDEQRMFVVLAIDTSLVEAEVKYEDPSRIYPHIYGPLNRDAMIGVLPILREADGTFVPPRAPSWEGHGQPGVEL